MRIDPNAKTANLPESSAGSRTAAARAQLRADLGTDEAKLGGHARVQQLQAQLREMPDGQQERVEALTRAVREGSYDVPPEKIAQSLLSEMSARAVLTR